MREFFDRVLAGTDGVGRLWAVLLAEDGPELPVAQAVATAQRIVLEPRSTLISAGRHHRAQVRVHPDVRVVEHPRDGGTLPRLLLPVLHVLIEDPDALVLVLPVDRPVTDARAFTRSLFRAVDRVIDAPRRVVLLGSRTAEPEPDRVWIVPDGSGNGIAGFVPGTGPGVSAALHAAGSMVFTSAMVGRARTIAAMAFESDPQWADALSDAWWDERRLAEAYQRLPASDLTTRMLERHLDKLDLMPMVGF